MKEINIQPVCSVPDGDYCWVYSRDLNVSKFCCDYFKASNGIFCYLFGTSVKYDTKISKVLKCTQCIDACKNNQVFENKT